MFETENIFDDFNEKSLIQIRKNHPSETRLRIFFSFFVVYNIFV